MIIEDIIRLDSTVEKLGMISVDASRDRRAPARLGVEMGKACRGPAKYSHKQSFAELGLGDPRRGRMEMFIFGNCFGQCKITTDDRLLKKIRGNREIHVALPNNALAELEAWYED